jgi:hypothetical protein
VAEPKWNRKNNGRWTERPKETTRQRIQKNRIQYRTHPTDVERKSKKKKGEDLKKKTSAKKQVSQAIQQA